MVWMALAMRVRTRLWRAGEGSEHRDRPLIRRRIERVRACALPRALLCCPDGLCSSVRAVRETFHEAVHTGTRGPNCASRTSSNATRSAAWSLSSAGSCRVRLRRLSRSDTARKAMG